MIDVSLGGYLNITPSAPTLLLILEGLPFYGFDAQFSIGGYLLMYTLKSQINIIL